MTRMARVNRPGPCHRDKRGGAGSVPWGPLALVGRRPRNRVARHGGFALLVGGDRLEPHRRRTGALVETDAFADEDRSDMHDDLVQQPGLEALPGDAGTE